MTRITSTSQVLALLRARLERNARSGRKSGPAPARTESRPLEKVHELAGGEDLPEADIARALIAGVLAEEFGEALVAEPRFQQIVDEVRRMIEADTSAKSVLAEAMETLRN